MKPTPKTLRRLVLALVLLALVVWALTLKIPTHAVLVSMPK